MQNIVFITVEYKYSFWDNKMIILEEKNSIMFHLNDVKKSFREKNHYEREKLLRQKADYRKG